MSKRRRNSGRNTSTTLGDSRFGRGRPETLTWVANADTVAGAAQALEAEEKSVELEHRFLAGEDLRPGVEVALPAGP